MRLNCKPGDLAMIVRTSSGFSSALGHVAVCVAPAPQGSPVTGLFGWIIDPPAMVNGVSHNACADWCLRPIRDNDGTDETLTWLDVPTGVLA